MQKYRVTLENYDGRCKRVTVTADNPYDAMAIAQKNGWWPVDVVAL
jgi:type II secretory pathway component PulF